MSRGAFVEPSPSSRHDPSSSSQHQPQSQQQHHRTPSSFSLKQQQATMSNEPPASSSAGKPPPLTIEQSRSIARTHFLSLRSFLRSSDSGDALKAAANRGNARDKLTRLTRQQFQELSTDVYDELTRREEALNARSGGKEQPFLPNRPEFHPKRNQARQKLATLPTGRFRDLAGDVYFELERRYPEFVEDSLDVQQEEDNNISSREKSPAGGSYRDDRERERDQRGPGGSNTAGANDIVVPNKSTLVLDEGPSASLRSGAGSRNGAPMGGGRSPPFGAGARGGGGGDSLKSPVSATSGRDRDERDDRLAGGGGGRGYTPTHNARASEASSIGTKFFGGYAGSTAASEAGGNGGGGGRRSSWNLEEEVEKVRSKYEYEVTVLKNKVLDLERDNGRGRQDLEQANDESKRRIRELEDQTRTHKERYEDQTMDLQRLEHEVRELRHAASQARSAPAPQQQDPGLKAELEQLRGERFEHEAKIEDLQVELRGLMDELEDLNERCRRLGEEGERSRDEARKAEDEARSWRAKYEAAKTELRNVKATSQLFVGAIKPDAEHMPAYADGAIIDSHVTGFQTSIDDLLQAARSEAPSAVLSVVKAVINAVEKIDLDVQQFEGARLGELSPADQERLQGYKARCHATLSNLMTATKNHATSFGVSPVSLVDAAASHVSIAVVDIVRLLKVRKSGPVSPFDAPEGRNPYSPPPPVPSLNNNLNSSRANGLYSENTRGGSNPNGSIVSGPMASSSASSSRDHRSPLVNNNPRPATSSHPPRGTSLGASARSLNSNNSANGQTPPMPMNGSGNGSRPYTAPERDNRDNRDLRDTRDRDNDLRDRERDRDLRDRDLRDRDQRGPRERDETARTATSSAYSNSNPGSAVPPSGSSFAFNRGGSGRDSSNVAPHSNHYGGGSNGDLMSPPQRYDDDPYGGINDRGQQGGQMRYGGIGGGPGGLSPNSEGWSPDPQSMSRSNSRGPRNEAELKEYLETQTDAIVSSIKELLTAIKADKDNPDRAPNFVELNETITQIITIASSIVAISKDAVRSGAPDPSNVLNELVQNCDRLSEIQQNLAPSTFTKTMKQQMASASFGVAKSLKSLKATLLRDEGDSMM